MLVRRRRLRQRLPNYVHGTSALGEQQSGRCHRPLPSNPGGLLRMRWQQQQRIYYPKNSPIRISTNGTFNWSVPSTARQCWMWPMLERKWKSCHYVQRQPNVRAPVVRAAPPGQAGFRLGAINANVSAPSMRRDDRHGKLQRSADEIHAPDEHGLLFTAAYTWSHTIDDAPSAFGSSGGVLDGATECHC